MMAHDFTAETTRFFAGLEADNSKAFWQANKERYDAAVRAPFAATLDMLEPEWGPFKTFRMNRDVRFSADKSPYKTVHGAVSRTCPYRYLHVDRDGILLVTGAYIFTKDQLALTRDRLANDVLSGDFLKIVSDLKDAGIELEPGGAAPLKKAPRGTDPDHPMIAYLRWKGMMASRRIAIESNPNSDSIAAEATTFWESTHAFTDWLRTQKQT